MDEVFCKDCARYRPGEYEFQRCAMPTGKDPANGKRLYTLQDHRAKNARLQCRDFVRKVTLVTRFRAMFRGYK